jgi:hypothetical protein
MRTRYRLLMTERRRDQQTTQPRRNRMSTIPVRIRHEDDLKAVPLTEWPIDDLTSLIHTLREWGLIRNGMPYDEATFGQIVVTDSGAYFEIVFGAGDES